MSNKIYNVVIKTPKSIEILSVFDNLKGAKAEVKQMVDAVRFRYDVEKVGSSYFLTSKTDEEDTIIYSVVFTHSVKSPFVVLTNDTFCNLSECKTLKDAADYILMLMRFNHQKMKENGLNKRIDGCMGYAVSSHERYDFSDTRYAIINCIKTIETC